MCYGVIEHFLRLFYAADKRTVNLTLGSTRQNQINRFDGGVGGQPDNSHLALSVFQHADILYRLIIHRNGAYDKIESIGQSFHFVRFVHVHIPFCSHTQCVGTLVFGYVEHGYIRTEVVEILHRHVSESAETHDCHMVATLHIA